MKNLNKFTKAELINKIKGLKSQSNDTNSGVFTNLMTSLLLMKNVLLKITLIAAIIKLFKKYSIFRRIWRILSSILFSIFGISLIDTFHIEILSNLINNTIDNFSSLFTYISQLFSKKVDVPIENPTKAPMRPMNGINPSSKGIQNENEGYSKISERLNKIINKSDEIIPEPEEIIEEIPENNKDKYLIIGGILILSCLTWYFWDDIKPIGSSILAAISSFRSRPGDDADGNINDLSESPKTNLQRLKNSIRNKIYGDKKDNLGPAKDLLNHNKDESTDSVKLGQSGESQASSTISESFNKYFIEDKGKSIADGELSATELARRAMTPQLTGFKELSLTSDKFNDDGNTVFKEINQFINYYDNSSFPKKELKQGFYKIIKERLNKIAADSPKYMDFIADDNINSKIERFLNLENEIFGDFPDINSPTYNDVALATVKEQDHWSERANTPSVRSQILSPLNNETIDLKPIEESERTGKLSLFEPFQQALIEVGYFNSPEVEVIDIPAVNIDSKTPVNIDVNKGYNSASDSSKDHYFPKPEVIVSDPSTGEEVNSPKESKGIFKALFDQINSRRNDFTSPNKIDKILVKEDSINPPEESLDENKVINENVEVLNQPAEITHDETSNENVEIVTHPEQLETGRGNIELKEGWEKVWRNKYKEKISSNNVIQPLETIHDETLTQVETQPIVNIQTEEASSSNLNKPDMSELLTEIKSHRLEYGTPTITDVGLQPSVWDRVNLHKSPLAHKSSFPDISNKLEDENNLFNDIDDIDTSNEGDRPDTNNEIKFFPEKGTQDNYNYFRTMANVIYGWKDELAKIKPIIDTNNHKITMDLGKMKDFIKTIHTATNDGYTASQHINSDYFKDTSEITIPWDNRISSRRKPTGCRIKEIHVTLLDDSIHSIYHEDISTHKELIDSLRD